MKFPKILVLLLCTPLGAACGEPIGPQSDDRIPPEVPTKVGYVTLTRPPDGFSSAVAWLQAIHDTRRAGQSWVETDYLRFYCRSGGQTFLVSGDEYENGRVGGGLFTRYSWYETNNSEPLPATFPGSVVRLQVSDRPDRVWHWWVEQYPRAVIPSNVDRCWLEARVRITGPALVQAGIDYWRTPTALYAGPEVNNREAGASNWYFESPDWQLITVAKP